MVKSKKDDKTKKTAKKVVKKVAAKKTVAKKVKAVKKVTPKKTVEKSIEETGMCCSPNGGCGEFFSWVSGHSGLVFAAFSVFLLGCILGMLSMDAWIFKSFENQKMVVIGNHTWLPVEGQPVELVVLNDKNCGQSCDPASSIASLKQNVSPALIERDVDIYSDEGKKLIAEFDVKTIPQYFFGKSVETVMVKVPNKEGVIEEKSLVDNLPKEVLTLKGNLYALNNAAIGFPTGKFIKAPAFKDLDTEPKKGTGKIQVVEFTDYQCPYCKRLHDQNKVLIAKLIKEGKITYMLKDFPLGFHAESAFAHKAANCVLKKSDNETYWKMHDQIFETVSQWSRKGEAAKTHFNKLASGLGVDISDCVDSTEVSKELAEDQQEGAKYGVRGTPALFIGRQMMPGAIGAAAFEKAVNDELGK